MNQGPIRILVADDEEVIREACLRILTRAGYEVDTVVDGEEALRLVSRRRFDLVLVDIKMPGLDGLQVMEEIKRISPETIVGVITGHGTAQTAAEARRVGSRFFLTKPFTPGELRETVARALGPLAQ
ncbi:MAG: response regulator [Thermodesulfobacteriota bacterium]